MTTKHKTVTRIDLNRIPGIPADYIEIESDLTTTRREVYLELCDSNSGSTGLVLAREQVCKLMDVLTFHLEATAHIDHRSEDEHQ